MGRAHQSPERVSLVRQNRPRLRLHGSRSSQEGTEPLDFQELPAWAGWQGTLSRRFCSAPPGLGLGVCLQCWVEEGEGEVHVNGQKSRRVSPEVCFQAPP